MLRIDDDYPELFAILAWSAEAAFQPLLGGDAAGELAFELAEYVRGRLGGTFFRMQAYREAVSADLFGPVPVEVPEHEPEIQWTTEGGNNVDLVAFVRLTALWMLARCVPKAEGADLVGVAAAVARKFHHDAGGRDQTYIPKGMWFDLCVRDRELWRQFNGHNYAQLAMKEGISVMRVRQIIASCREKERKERQADLFSPASR